VALDQQQEIKEKSYFDVKVKALIPADLNYRVLAESEQEALKMVTDGKVQPNGVQYQLAKKKMLSAIVYIAGTIMAKLSKKF